MAHSNKGGVLPWSSYDPATRLELAKNRRCPAPVPRDELAPVMALINAAIPRKALTPTPRDVCDMELLISEYVGFISPRAQERQVCLPGRFVRAYHKLWKRGWFG